METGVAESGVAESGWRSGQYLTFRIARHNFAMEARSVRGILPARDMERVQRAWPGVHSFGENIRGYATLCGKDLPVIDLGSKLRLPNAAQGRNWSIVAVEVETPEGPRLAGFLADRVNNVVHARAHDFSNGKLRVRGRLRQLIEPAALLSG